MNNGGTFKLGVHECPAERHVINGENIFGVALDGP